jgi:hypothetical protein
MAFNLFTRKKKKIDTVQNENKKHFETLNHETGKWENDPKGELEMKQFMEAEKIAEEYYNQELPSWEKENYKTCGCGTFEECYSNKCTCPCHTPGKQNENKKQFEQCNKKELFVEIEKFQEMSDKNSKMSKRLEEIENKIAVLNEIREKEEKEVRDIKAGFLELKEAVKDISTIFE